MKIEVIKSLFSGYPEESLKDGCELKCSACKEWSNHNDWEATSVACDDCGSHEAIMCPKCDETFDNVHADAFECR